MALNVELINKYISNLSMLYKSRSHNFNLINLLDQTLPLCTLEEIDEIKEKLEYKSNTSLFEDIVNFDTFSCTVERFTRCLTFQYNSQLTPKTDDVFCAVMVECYKLQNEFDEKFEYQLRHAYIILLEDTIKSLLKKGYTEIAERLEFLKYNLFIKYFDLSCNPYIDYFKMRDEIGATLFFDTKIDMKITEAIDKSVSFENIDKIDEKDIDKLAFLYSFQTYVRSLFAVLNDDYRLAEYNQYYTSLNIKNQLLVEAFRKCEGDIKKLNMHLPKS